MKRKVFATFLIFAMSLSFSAPQASAIGAKAAAASLLIPTTGQAMNGQLGTTKSKVMGGVEVGLVTTLAILGGVVGGPVVWAALGPMIANHAWSAADAYRGAQNQVDPQVQQQMVDAQQTLDYSRQRRYDREELARSSVRDRILMAGEQANY